MPKRPPITIEPCPCGHPSCKDFHLVNFGKFVQGSGFTHEEATHVAYLLNQFGLRQRRQALNARQRVDVPRDGTQAFGEGWDVRANPHDPATAGVENMRWIAAWWSANADAFESHIHGSDQ